MTNGLKDGTVFTIGNCRYLVSHSTADGFKASVDQPSPPKEKKGKFKTTPSDVDEKTIKDTFGKHTKE